MLRKRAEMIAHKTPGDNTSFTLIPAFDSPHSIGMIRQQQAPGGFNPFHSHNCEEVMLQQRGTVTVTLEETHVELEPGDLLIIPANTKHQIVNTGPSEAEWLLIWPAGARFFSADGNEIEPVWARLQELPEEAHCKL